MTLPLSSREVAVQMEEHFPKAVIKSSDTDIVITSESLLQVARFLKDTPGLDFDYLASITSTDYLDHFEVIYHLVSIEHNHSLTLKTHCYDRDNPSVPSVVELWRGADFQEREVYDLMGVAFTGHPNLKRILLWEGFEGHPLRKDYFNGH